MVVKLRGGQPAHTGGSNNQKAEALFKVPLDGCPDCHAEIEGRRPATKRTWDVLGDWVLQLFPKDGRARAMIELAKTLAASGAHGACVCVSISFERGYCPACGKIVKASVAFLIDGSAMGEVCHSEALLFAERVPDTYVAAWLADLHNFPLQYDAVRTGRLARSGPLTPINDKIEDHMAAAPWHERDESPGKGYLVAAEGGGGGGGGRGSPPASLEEAAVAAVSAVGATSNREIQYVVAATPDAVLIRVSPNRSAKSINERLSKLVGKPYVSDEFVGYARDGTPIRQSDHPHLLRKTEYPAAEALRVLYGEDEITYSAVILHRQAASEWARDVVGMIMAADPAARRVGDSRPAPDAAAAAAAAATAMAEAVEAAAKGESSSFSASFPGLRPLPPFPPPPCLSLPAPSASPQPVEHRPDRRAPPALAPPALAPPALPAPALAAPAPSASNDGPRPGADGEAAARRNEIAADALFASICHWIKFWDTASAGTELRLWAAVRVALSFYAEGHPARKSIENAMPALFAALRLEGMPFDSTLVERAVRDVVHPERLAHRHIRCAAAAEASSKGPTFTGTCRRNGISPMRAFRRIMRNPEWNIFGMDRPPPPPVQAPAPAPP